MYARFQLNRLNLEPENLENLTAEKKIEKIRLQWLSLCSMAQNTNQVIELTQYYHDLIDPRYHVQPAINHYFTRKEFAVSHTALSLSQRLQIQKTYDDLLRDFFNLNTEDEKTSFAQENADFLSLAQTLQSNQHDFDEFLGQSLFQQQNKNLSTQFIHHWRVQIIQLFGIEGLDDFQYRHALATGELRPILAREKLRSPVKIIVALLNSIILAILTTLNPILKLHIAMRFGLLLLAMINPALILLIQLPRIKHLFMLLACPINYLIRPLSLYTQWSPQSISLLLLSGIITVTYAALYTTLIAKLILVLPLLNAGLIGYNIWYLSGILYGNNLALRAAFLQQTGLYVMMTQLFLLILKPMLNTNALPEDPAPANRLTNEWKLGLSLYSIIAILASYSNVVNSVAALPQKDEIISQEIIRVTKNKCNVANLSHSFFNTPKGASALNLNEVAATHTAVFSF